MQFFPPTHKIAIPKHNITKVKETKRVIEFYVTELPVRAMIGRRDFSALLAHASALLVHCLGNFFSVRPVDQ